jgi:hypothetical protein
MAFPSTFIDIQQAVIYKARLDQAQDLSFVKDWINQIYYQVCVELEFYTAVSDSAAAGANATNVTIPSTIIAVDYVVPTGSTGVVYGPMDMITFDEILQMRAYTSTAITTGAPSRYCFRSGVAPTVEFWPAANGGEILTFYGSRFPAPLVGDGDPPIFPEPYATKVLEYGALVNAAEYKKDLIMMGEFQNMYADWLTRFRGFTNTRVGNRTEQFQVIGRTSWPQPNDVDVRRSNN